jgi:hypothetical protein
MTLFGLRFSTPSISTVESTILVSKQERLRLLRSRRQLARTAGNTEKADNLLIEIQRLKSEMNSSYGQLP